MTRRKWSTVSALASTSTRCTPCARNTRSPTAWAPAQWARKTSTSCRWACRFVSSPGMKPTSLAGVAGASWLVFCAGCGATETPASRTVSDAFVSTAVASFSEPWAMTFLPDGRLLVTEKKGALKLLDVATGRKGDVTGVPRVAYGGQGG